MTLDKITKKQSLKYLFNDIKLSLFVTGLDLSTSALLITDPGKINSPISTLTGIVFAAGSLYFIAEIYDTIKEYSSNPNEYMKKYHKLKL